VDQIAESLDTEDLGGVIATMIPSIFGVSVQNYDSEGFNDLDLDVQKKKILIESGAHIDRPNANQEYSINGVTRKLTRPEYDAYLDLSEKIILKTLAEDFADRDLSKLSKDQIMERLNTIKTNSRKKARGILFSGSELKGEERTRVLESYERPN
jgi:hypothetical protein